jgi:O-antigen/teichoic acid export membrane protein
MTSDLKHRRRLDVVVMRGFLWTSGGRLLVQLATWIVSLLVARLLTPRDYGIAAMASLYVGFAQMVAELGIGAAIVQRANLTQETVAALMGVSLITGVLLAIVSVPAGIALSAFYHEPILVMVVGVYGVNFIPAAFRSVSGALLSRDMAFQKLTMLALLEAVSASLTGLGLALSGWSVWSLVLGNIAGTCVATLVSLMWAYPGLSLNFATLRGTGALTFGYKILVSRIAWYVYASTDFLIIGRRIGAQALGQYQLAYQFASVPADRITGALTQVLFPVLSTLQKDSAELGRYFRTSTEACVLVLMPAYVGLALVADDLISVALGPKWQGAAGVLAILSLAAVVRSVTGVSNSVIVSAGNATFLAKMSLLGLVVFPPTFYVAANWGPAAVAAVWLLLYPPILGLPTLAVALRAASLRFSDLHMTVRPYVFATILMALAAYSARRFCADTSEVTRLAVTVATGVSSYAAVLMLFYRDRLRRYFALATRALSPGREASAGTDSLPASEPSR